MNKFGFLAAAAFAAMASVPAAVRAQAIITNGTVGLGVDTAGQLNISGPASAIGTTFYGLRDLTTNYEATAAGCLCEGWGAAVNGTSSTVYANNANGSLFTAVSFTSTATTATSVVRSVDGLMEVTHNFFASASTNLFEVAVSIRNISGADFTGNTLYRRVMDWDIEPTAFNEYSTIQGTTGAANVRFASNDGFASSNPLTGNGNGSVTGDFIDFGPTDQGALFDFSFDPLAAGATQSFSIFFGSAPTEATALGALGTVGAEVYSLGQAADDRTGGAVDRATFIFGFKGVGGTALPDPTSPVPEPATWAMMLTGFGLIGATMRRRKLAFKFA